MNAIKFKNFTDKEFTWNFDGAPNTFKAGQEVYLPEFQARFFAKHLADQEMNRLGLITDNMVERSKLEMQALPGEDPTPTVEEIQIQEEVKKKVKKVTNAKGKEVVKEEEFADLNQ